MIARRFQPDALNSRTALEIIMPSGVRLILRGVEENPSAEMNKMVDTPLL
jgi:hypothetical protein